MPLAGGAGAIMLSREVDKDGDGELALDEFKLMLGL